MSGAGNTDMTDLTPAPDDGGPAEPVRVDDATRLRRWRLALGSEAEVACGAPLGAEADIDQALAALYEPDAGGGLGADRRGGRGASRPGVARWLGDIRRYFP